MTQLQRIDEMERRMTEVQKAIDKMSDALAEFGKARESIAVLSRYYDNEWRRDFEDDSAGKLSAQLKRGVLSEDGLWNLLDEWRELTDELKKSVEAG